MDGDSSSDDDEIKHIQNHIDYKTNKKRKEVPPASIPEHLESDQQIQNVIHNNVEIPGLHENEPQASNSGRRNRDNVQNMNFPWLELVGPTCHSVKQAKGGMDLSHMKRKYRNMRCLTCAQHNPSTPWAELWPRKFELQTLVDHAKSGAHIKSETAQKSMPDYIPSVEHPSVFKVVSGSGKALQLDKTARDESTDASLPAVDGFAELGDEDGDKVSVRIRGVLNAGGAHIVAHSTRVRPDWLYSEGNLCLSDKQVADPTRPQGIKKKYKQMACLYCREYVPDSMWAHLRPRKFESAVIGDHERSAVHQKAVELRLAQMGGNGELADIAQLEAMRSAQELLRASNETIKFSEY